MRVIHVDPSTGAFRLEQVTRDDGHDQPLVRLAA
jgi:hypothetical protein